ncbi:MAG: SPOR domain-containing protein [Gammaproteobacteria bacterium]|nr:SPOR domain-containing protein [Gammaproteobacteria bacterium]MCW8983509.1 SPOR domain-containing protein [Gammaproteobacteria bacterium]
MRTLIYLLIFVNILYLGVNFFILEPNAVSSKSVAKDKNDNENYSLVLLKEIKKESGGLISDAVKQVVAEEVLEQKQSVECLKITGDWDAEGFSAVKQSLSSKDISVIIEGKERRKKVNYWVLIPPFDTKQEAITAKRQLQSEKIVDTFIIKSGARSNALSLGLYSKEMGAERRASYVNSKKLGIARASIEELTLYVDRYWIKVATDAVELEGITAAIGDGILDIKIDQCEIER